MKMCINTQTPLVQFSPTLNNIKSETPIDDLSKLVEGKDYNYSTGGVTRMIYPLVKQMLSDGYFTDAHWVSLNSSGPETIRAGGIVLHHVSLQKERLKNYGNVKEVIWGAVHGLNTDTLAAENMFWTDDFADYAYYNRNSAELIKKLDKDNDFDLFYIHDFQQLPVGQMLDTLKPKMFRWHIPFDESMIPDQWKELLATYFNSYDMVIASSGKYLESLKVMGFTGNAKKVYPFVDPKDFSHPSPEEISFVCKRLGIQEKDDVALIVARMDPMKGQDRAIKALAGIAGRFRALKLVLVGNGSFSSSAQGLGLSKSAKWRAELEHLCGDLGLKNRVVFAGHLTQKELDAMYERCKFSILSSIKEGFGLVVIESWLHRKSVLVTERAGASELIEEGVNGMLFDPDDAPALEAKMEVLLNDEELASRMGERGFETSKICSMEEGLKAEKEVITNLVGE